MECLNTDCREKVPDHLRYCVVCGTDATVPNVRAAARTDEANALNVRILAVERDAILAGTAEVLADFRLALDNSSAVVCRSLARLNELVSSDNQLFATFYENVRSNAVLPEDNEWDRIRQSADSLLFPFYFEELRFAALSFDGSGVSGYGSFCVTLKESAIRDRASVLEENAILFVRKQRIVAGDFIPLGYRATWPNRGALGVAKLGRKLIPTTAPNDYQSILMGSRSRDGDFIEVHIFGPLHRRAIQHVNGTEPKRKADKVILGSLKRKLNELGVTYTIR